MILSKIQNYDYPLLFVKNNLIESVNKTLKNKLLGSKYKNNWLYIVK